MALIQTQRTGAFKRSKVLGVRVAGALLIGGLVHLLLSPANTSGEQVHAASKPELAAGQLDDAATGSAAVAADMEAEKVVAQAEDLANATAVPGPATAGVGEAQQVQPAQSIPKDSALRKEPPADVDLDENVPAWAQCPEKPCEFAHLMNGTVNMSESSHSQFQEDLWLYNHLFYEKVNGFAIEMGAIDGISASNTYFFSKAASWKSLLIEANPGSYGDLKKRRADAITAHAAVCGEFRTVHFHAAANVGGIFEFMAEDFRKVFHPNVTVEGMPEVTCVPLQWLLDRYGITHVDLFSLDVEGGELEVLQTLDFSRVQIKVIIAELDGHDKQRDEQVVQLLMGVGYDVIPRSMKSKMSQQNALFVLRAAWPELAHAPNITEPLQFD